MSGGGRVGSAGYICSSGMEMHSTMGVREFPKLPPSLPQLQKKARETKEKWEIEFYIFGVVLRTT